MENLHREDLDPINEAEAYATLKDMSTKVSGIARLVERERTYVSHSLRLLRLHPKVRGAVRQHTIPQEHARARGELMEWRFGESMQFLQLTKRKSEFDSPFNDEY